MRTIFAIAIFLASTVNAFCDYKYDDGNKLLMICDRGPGTAENAVCLGYITGIIESIMAHGYDCRIPFGVTDSQITSIAIDYLRKNPSKRHERGVDLVTASFLDSFKCEKR